MSKSSNREFKHALDSANEILASARAKSIDNIDISNDNRDHQSIKGRIRIRTMFTNKLGILFDTKSEEVILSKE
jgi:hypothetical protein